ncbi:SDR family oxidoreductase [Mesorhizobium sp. SB112]|uniref:SDR family oxidoreductase n=1 Tax=Mesorhizobium sp. SB112 TaxID=3151853 RepID=UPI0032666D92
MAKVFIVGGAGKIALRLSKILAERSHTPSALHRKPEQAATIIAQGAVPVQGDLTKLTVDELAGKMAGSDVVVFSAGAGGAGMEVTNAIDGKGLELSVDAAQKAGVKRFLLVSVFPDALRDGERNEGFENYMRVKKQSDVYLASSALDWVIVRPGTLTEDAGTGHVRACAAIPYGEIPRDDVAAFLAELIDHPAAKKVILELTTGNTPVPEWTLNG